MSSSLSSSLQIARDSVFNPSRLAEALSFILDKSLDEEQMGPLLELVLGQKNSALKRYYGFCVLLPTNPEDPWVCWLMDLKTELTASLTLYHHETKGIRVLHVTTALNRHMARTANMGGGSNSYH